jgi:hypothetical protein
MSAAAMSPAVEISAFDSLPARDRLLAAVLDQLEPMFAMLYDGDLTMGRGAAMDAMEPMSRMSEQTSPPPARSSLAAWPRCACCKCA